MRKILLFLFCCWTAVLSAQPEIQWSRCYGGSQTDVGSAFILTSDGGYVFGGLTTSTNGDVSEPPVNFNDAWMAKIDEDGEMVWETVSGFEATMELYDDIVETTTGNFIGCGYAGIADDEVFLGTYAAGGTLVSTLTLGNDDVEDQSEVILETDDGNYLIGGSTGSTVAGLSGCMGQKDAWIVKVDESANIIWSQCYGGSKNEGVGDLVKASDGGYVFVGATWSDDGDVSAYNGSGDVWVVKIDENGLLEWEQSYGGSGSEGVSNILATVDGGYIRDEEINNLPKFS